ncbi:unnamed protein product [Paramecium pentaurelia]|uniref:Transmembrane protein n=1 Tax=Paramecium pentaurelia TaxID=43138 RepID=A0A8S1V2Z1_9CILI|nr:unnamed protein product [Paramecium pentaurelia]
MSQYSDINNQQQEQGIESQEPYQPNTQQQSNEISNIQNEKEKYCGGLLYRNDHILIKALKIILVFPLLPIVLLWRLLYCITNLLIDCCTNQVYNCLLICYEKMVQCLQWLCHIISIILNKIYSCLAFICNKLLDAIYCLGRCSKQILDWYAIFIINTIYKFAHLRSIMQEFTSIITIPISLKIIVPLALYFNYKIFIPLKNAIIFIVNMLLHILELFIICLYNSTIDYILKPFFKYIIWNFLLFLKFLFFTILYKFIIINFYKGLRWTIVNFYNYILLNIYEYVLVKFLYRIVLTYSYKAAKLFFYNFLYKLIFIPFSKIIQWLVIDFLYEIVLTRLGQLLKFIVVDVIYKVLSIITEFICDQICLNIYRCLTWFIIKIIYQIILKNIYIYILKPFYNIIVSIIRIISKIIYRFLLLPLWILAKCLFNGLIKIISITSTFIYEYILTPIWNLIVSITTWSYNFIKNILRATKQLSIDLWIAIRNLFRRIRNNN